MTFGGWFILAHERERQLTYVKGGRKSVTIYVLSVMYYLVLYVLPGGLRIHKISSRAHISHFTRVYELKCVSGCWQEQQHDWSQFAFNPAAAVVSPNHLPPPLILAPPGQQPQPMFYDQYGQAQYGQYPAYHEYDGRPVYMDAYNNPTYVQPFAPMQTYHPPMVGLLLSLLEVYIQNLQGHVQNIVYFCCA